MIIELMFLLSITAFALAVGFARQEEQTVRVPLKSSVRYRGKSYHPHSEGVRMPFSHAVALGFTKDDFVGEQPEEEEDTGESESKGGSEEQDSSGDPESKESSEGQQADQTEEETESKVDAGESDKQDQAEPIPEDTPEYDKLIKDERFATVEALLENQDQLTEINGVAEKTAAKIVEHVKSKQG
jgi:hypothetical protein